MACVRVRNTEQDGKKMIERGLHLTGSDAELLGDALAAVKIKAHEKSETSLDDSQALDALVSWFRTAEKEEEKKETHHAYLSPLLSVLSWALFSTGLAARKKVTPPRKRVTDTTVLRPINP